MNASGDASQYPRIRQYERRDDCWTDIIVTHQFESEGLGGGDMHCGHQCTETKKKYETELDHLI